MVFSTTFIESQRKWLLLRRKSKSEILAVGGERALGHSRRDIVKIDLALKRIKEGQYGLCVSCGCPIERRRLERFQPETPICAICANKN